jgi:hypothetical protein
MVQEGPSVAELQAGFWRIINKYSPWQEGSKGGREEGKERGKKERRKD